MMGTGGASATRAIERYNEDEFASPARLGDIADNAKNLFYGTGRNPVGFFSDKDKQDKEAVDALYGYWENEGSRDAFSKIINAMNAFSPEQRRRVNNDNSINDIILREDVMSDKTGQLLLEELRNLQITINVP
jgi:hypothetical protein